MDQMGKLVEGKKPYPKKLISNLNSFICILKADFVVKNLPAKKTWDPDGFTGEFCHTLKREIIVIFANTFRK